MSLNHFKNFVVVTTFCETDNCNNPSNIAKPDPNVSATNSATISWPSNIWNGSLNSWPSYTTPTSASHIVKSNQILSVIAMLFGAIFMTCN